MPLYLGNTPIGGTNVSFSAAAGDSEDLTAVLDAQETLIAELEAELEGKAAGGGSGGVETVTGTVSCDSFTLQTGNEKVYYTDGSLTPCSVSITNTEQTITVLKGSIVYVIMSSMNPPSGEIEFIDDDRTFVANGDFTVLQLI